MAVIRSQNQRAQDQRAQDQRGQDQQQVRHDKWRAEANAKIPEIAARIFALRGTDYPNADFHSQLEFRLGTTIRMLNENRNTTVLGRISDISMFDEIVRDLENAERSLRSANSGADDLGANAPSVDLRHQGVTESQPAISR